MYDERFMRRAIALAAEALTKPGTEPFGAVVVRLDQATVCFAPLTAAERHSIDCALLRAEAGVTVDKRNMPAEQGLASEAVAVLEQWVVRKKAW